MPAGDPGMTRPPFPSEANLDTLAADAQRVREPAADSLDAAWAEAEAALPNPHGMDLGIRRTPGGLYAWASTQPGTGTRADRYVEAEGPTPAAALRALAAALRERAK